MKKRTPEQLRDAFLLGQLNALQDTVDGARKDNPFWVSDPRHQQYENGYNEWIAQHKETGK